MNASDIAIVAATSILNNNAFIIMDEELDLGKLLLLAVCIDSSVSLPLLQAASKRKEESVRWSQQHHG